MALPAWTIVGYTYKAENLCRTCTHGAARRENPDPALVESMSVETELNDWANTVGIDRDIEESYDSDDFPKVIFASEVAEGECCGECHEPII